MKALKVVILRMTHRYGRHQEEKTIPTATFESRNLHITDIVGSNNLSLLDCKRTSDSLQILK